MTRLLLVDYDLDYDPAAPFLPITVDGYVPDFEPVIVSAFVDTGADGTMLPKSLLMAVGAEYADTVVVRGSVDGARRLDRYTVRIRLGSTTIHAISAVAMPSGSEPLIGRDVLNQLVLTLNGPAQSMELLME